jgi:hypothetical protein
MTTAGAPLLTFGHMFVSWHTSVSNGYSHAFTEAAFSEGTRQWRGQFQGRLRDK